MAPALTERITHTDVPWTRRVSQLHDTQLCSRTSLECSLMHPHQRPSRVKDSGVQALAALNGTPSLTSLQPNLWGNAITDAVASACFIGQLIVPPLERLGGGGSCQLPATTSCIECLWWFLPSNLPCRSEPRRQRSCADVSFHQHANGSGQPSTLRRITRRKSSVKSFKSSVTLPQQAHCGK